MNTVSRYTQIFFIGFLACSIWFAGMFFDRKNNYNDNSISVENKLTQVSNEQVINLDEITSFKWDNAYIFEPYYPKSEMYKTVGYKWDNSEESISEDTNHIVFIKDGKVVCYTDGKAEHNKYGFLLSNEEYENGVIKIEKNTEKKFKVVKNEDIIYLKAL